MTRDFSRLGTASRASLYPGGAAVAAELGSLALLACCPWLLVVRRDGGRAAGNQLVPVGVSCVAAGPVTVGWGPPRSIPLSPPQARTVAPGGRPQFPVLSLQPVPASSPGYWLLCSWRPAWTPQAGPTSRAWSLGRPRGRPGHPPKRRRSGQGQATGRTGGCGGLSEGSLERPIRWPRPPQAPGDTPGPGTRSRPLFDIWETQQKHKRKTPPQPPQASRPSQGRAAPTQKMRGPTRLPDSAFFEAEPPALDAGRLRDVQDLQEPPPWGKMSGVPFPQHQTPPAPSWHQNNPKHLDAPRSRSLRHLP